MKNILTISFVFFIVFAQAQSDKKFVRQGNKSYQDNKFPEAEIDYRKALDKNPNSLSANFNLADAMYEQENYEKSTEIFAKIGQSDLSKEQKGMAFYNLGNSFLKAKQYEQSIEAYKMALRNNPTDEDARYNLEYARKMMKQEQEKQDQNKDKNDQQKDQDKKDQEKQDQKDQKKDDQGEKDQNQEQQDKQDNPEDQGQAENQMNDQQSRKISKKDAERMLEALKNNEKETLEKLKKGKKANVRVIKKEKDW